MKTDESLIPAGSSVPPSSCVASVTSLSKLQESELVNPS